jgi:hypothetical protein
VGDVVVTTEGLFGWGPREASAERVHAAGYGEPVLTRQILRISERKRAALTSGVAYVKKDTWLSRQELLLCAKPIQLDLP